MCGIAGLWSASSRDSGVLTARAEAMADAIAHRGPDDHGAWSDAAAGVALGHRRLSIVDLSPEGHQPMHCATGRRTIVFNGEIYNHGELRRALEAAGAAPRWRGHSDTEVLLAAIAHWGVTDAIRRSVGMFAIALWDHDDRTLTLIRDRLGEKPLYYGFAGDTLVFGSELKALRAYSGWAGEVDRDVLAAYMRYSCVPAPASIYRGIHQLAPGGMLIVRESDVRARSLPEPERYWALAPSDALHGLSDDEALERLDATLRAAVRDQMVADVPLGAFLSGGIDSSTIVALMQSMASRPVRTYSIGFAESAYDESKHAKAVAGHLGTEHTELAVTPEEALAVIPRLPEIYDEPFGDSSQIPTVLVARLARPHVTVALSGDGGDELFGGYSRYFWAESVVRRTHRIPVAARVALARALGAIPAPAWTRIAQVPRAFGARGLEGELAGDRILKALALVAARDESALYRGLVAPWPNETIVLGGQEKVRLPPATGGTLAERMMFRDAMTYLPDDILAKVDRAAMSVALETRIPLLDHRVVELAFALPRRLKIREGRGKWLLRRLLDRYVPRDLVERPKMGFSLPLDGWLRGPLREWAAALLDPARLAREGFLDPAPIERAWRAHLSGHRNLQHRLWNVLMFQTWLERERRAGR